MGLAKHISASSHRELADLAAYVAGEIMFEMGEAEDGGRVIEAEAVTAAIKAWAITQLHEPDGDA